MILKSKPMLVGLVFVLLTIGIQTAEVSNSKSESGIWPDQIVHWKLEGNKELVFIATHNTIDLTSPIHQSIKDNFRVFKPTMLIMEGFSSQREGISPERIKVKSKKICEEVGKCNANLYAAYQATIHRIPFVGGEIWEAEQLKPLSDKGYTFEDVAFYLLVQHLPYFYREGDFDTHTQKFTPQTWEPMCDDFLQRIIATWLNQKIDLTYQEFLKWWQVHFNDALDMEKEFSDWDKGCQYHEPNYDLNALYTQKIAYWFHRNRGDYCQNLIQKTVAENTKTLVVYGSHQLRDHWDDLIKAFGQPISVTLIEQHRNNLKV